MAAKFFNVYIRRAEQPFSSFNLTANTLEGDLNDWDRLELQEERARLGLEPLVDQLGDGCQYTGAEKLIFEGGTLQVSKAEYEYLRSAFHNQACDVLFYDPNDDSFIEAAFGLRIEIRHIAESGPTQVIKISGSRTTSIAVTSKLLIGSNSNACLISGKVLRADGVTPVSQADVSITGNPGSVRTYTEKTDKDGNYLIMAETPALPTTVTYTYTVTKSGLTFTAPGTITVARNGEYSKDVLATT